VDGEVIEIQDNLEITIVRTYPLYSGGRLLVGQVTKHKGLRVGTDPPYCRIESSFCVQYPVEWFPVTEIRSMHLLSKMLDEQNTPDGIILPKDLLLDCYRSAWKRSSLKEI
jgi:hypothetical protein